MQEVRTAKLFKNGSSQAVRLPADFRFDGNQVYVHRDEKTGDVVLSSRPGVRTWSDFFDLLDSVDVPGDFMKDRPMNSPPQERDLFKEDR